MKSKQQILIKFLNGNCSEEEIELLKQWLDEGKLDEDFLSLLVSEWEDNADENKSRIEVEDQVRLNKIHEALKSTSNEYPLSETSMNVSHRKENKSPSLGSKTGPSKIKVHQQKEFYYKIAATLLFALLAVAVVYFFVHEEPKPQLQVAEQDRTIIKRTSFGQKLKVKMPDGSLIHLNSNSEISFTKSFTESREIFLKGEAFFSVKADSLYPFIVHTENLTTKALGTSFNIKEGNSTTDVVLKNGNVEVEQVRFNESVRLNPGTKLKADDHQKGFQIENANVEEVLAWTQGKLIFKSKPLHEILKNLEQWYGVQIKVDKGINLQSKISGEFNNESLQNILKGLSFSMDFHYQVSGGEVHIIKTTQ